ncbi:MAG: AbrB family transcriptional regulator [Peptococcaceae bacterium BRH_c4a]|nr:MAG: AbrB family transcriptional regulator [Peptococcaceae bacterium BRH_c4a]
MRTTIVISAKGQISIPVSLRRRYNLKKGDQLAVEENDGAIILRPLPKHPLLKMKGKYGGDREPLTELLLKERRAERERSKY